MKRAIFYSLTIAGIILGLLLSMLDVGDSGDVLVVKWAVAGLLSVVVTAISVGKFSFLARGSKRESLPIQTLEVIAVPLLVLVLAAIGLILVGREDLFEGLFQKPPLSPYLILFALSLIGHLLGRHVARGVQD